MTLFDFLELHLDAAKAIGVLLLVLVLGWILNHD